MKRAISILCVLTAAGLSTAAGAPAEVTEEAVLELMPRSGEPVGWARDGGPLTYVADDLWEYIDGSAENFLAYGFERVVAQDYLSGDGKSLKVEIYRHSSPLMAFGIYSQFRDAELTFLEIGNEGFTDGYSLHFWQGPYYVKLYVFEEGLADAMRAFAGAVGERIGEKGALPGTVDCLPHEGMVPRSLKYLTEGVLGSGKLPPAFTAEYQAGGSGGKLYLFQLEGGEDASRLFDVYGGEIGAEAEEIEIGGASCRIGSAEARYRGRMVLFSAGSVFGVVTGFENAPAAARSLAEETMSRCLGQD